MCTININIDVEEGEFIAVKSLKYHERPLIGQITSKDIRQRTVTIDWYIGTYSGTWRPWKGRDGGKTVTFTETVDFTDILQKVTLTKSMRLPSSIVQELKAKY